MSLRFGIAWSLACGAVAFALAWGIPSLIGSDAKPTEGHTEGHTEAHRQRLYMTCRVSYVGGQAYLNDCRTFTR